MTHFSPHLFYLHNYYCTPNVNNSTSSLSYSPFCFAFSVVGTMPPMFKETQTLDPHLSDKTRITFCAWFLCCGCVSPMMKLCDEFMMYNPHVRPHLFRLHHLLWLLCLECFINAYYALSYGPSIPSSPFRPSYSIPQSLNKQEASGPRPTFCQMERLF